MVMRRRLARRVPALRVQARRDPAKPRKPPGPGGRVAWGRRRRSRRWPGRRGCRRISRATSTSWRSSPPSAMSTSRSRSARRPTSRTTASASRASRRRAERGVAKLAKELLPALDNLDRALEAAAQDDPLLDGVRLVRGELSSGLARRRDRVLRRRRRHLRPGRARGRRPAAGGGCAEWERGRGLPARLPAGREHDPPGAGARRRITEGLTDGIASRLLQDARGREKGDPRGDQEGLSQARAQVPPRHQSRRQEGRGALQGDLPGSRRARRSREAQAVRQRLGTIRHRWGTGWRLRRLRQLRLRRLLDGRHPLQSVRRRVRLSPAGGEQALAAARGWSAATTWRLRSRFPSIRRFQARRFPCRCRCARLAQRAMAPAPSPARPLLSVLVAKAAESSPKARGCSRSPSRARAAAARAR